MESIEGEKRIQDVGELRDFACALVEAMRAEKGSIVLTLSGDLGAGKTALVRELASCLGVEENVTSPTFVIQKEYETGDEHFPKLIHIDAYRLLGNGELEALGWNELIQENGNLICVEWPEQVEGLEFGRGYHIEIEALDDESRKVNVFRR